MNELITETAATPASPTSETETGFEEPHRKVLSFGVADDTFAIPISLISEIIEYGSVTRVPMMPEHVRGVLNLRGSVVPVIDLAARLGKAPADIDKRTCIAVLTIPLSAEERIELGIVVDSVNEVLDIAEKDIEPAPSFGANIPPEFIDGMGKVRDQFVVILDPQTTFAVDELSALEGQMSGMSVPA